MSFRFERTGQASGKIFIADRCVADIRDMKMGNLCFHPLHDPIVGMDVPVNLFWQQYIDHEHPERNAGSNGLIEILSEDPLRLRCNGTTQSTKIRSTYDVSCLHQDDRIMYDIDASLFIAPGYPWPVITNPHHGEIEFCQLWPLGVFSSAKQFTKRYQACLVSQGDRITRIPHHHFESADKQNIPMSPGDMFCWVLEDENPTVEILSSIQVNAGLCAYMWDGHFGYDCDGELLLGSNEPMHVTFRLSARNRVEAETMLEEARDAEAELHAMPVYVHGTNTFRETPALAAMNDAWPWSSEADEVTSCERDVSIGFDDTFSLRISSVGGEGRWIATTLGPAFNQDRFIDNVRYRLTALVKTQALEGDVRIALRLHRSGMPGLFDVSMYEVFASTGVTSKDQDWNSIVVTTPVIHPEPDRVHLILEMRGSGTAWFDNVLFETGRDIV